VGVDRLGDASGFGAAIGAPQRRLILITGEGSHQMTAQEISQFGRHGLHPIIFVLNNSGYLSERMLCKDMALSYNDIAAWNYAELPMPWVVRGGSLPVSAAAVRSMPR
jgi:indolepyruvate decarboxylase